MNRLGTSGLLVLALVAAGCTSETVVSTATVTQTAAFDPEAPTTTGAVASTVVAAPTTVALSELRVTLAEVDFGFNGPVLLVADPAGGADFVVEQPGRIVRADGDAHAVALDIRDSVKFGGEQGLLGLAFHPDFARNSLAYVNYVDKNGRTVVAQFEVHDGVFDAGSGSVVLRIDQPAGNHNGGMIAFGPDGALWVGMGDGGAANDEFKNGQNAGTLLGSMLRVTVPGTNGSAYDIPETNPYADGVAGAPEVYWTGLRNPWRFSFDFFEDGTGADVWIADVGQNEVEEVSVMFSGERSGNFGWPVMEGSECFQSDDCDKTPFVLPASEYGHEDGCSITGGYVYRGNAIPELNGHFFYSDFCSGIIRSYSPATGDHDWSSMTGAIPSVAGFGIGGDGELYVVSLGGTIYRLERVQ
jgi:glucose/arabinose dehydrogenase